MPQGANSDAALLHKLCCLISGKRRDETISLYNNALKCIESSVTTAVENDEYFYLERIKERLNREKRPQDMKRMQELHRKLKNGTILKNRPAVLAFLYYLCDGSQVKDSRLTTFSREINTTGFVTSTPQVEPRRQQHLQGAIEKIDRFFPHNTLNTVTTVEASPIIPIYWSTGGPRTSKKKSRVQESPYTNPVRAMPNRETTGNSCIRSTSYESPPRTMNEKRSVKDNYAKDVSETELLQEIIFTFQGIDGKIMKLDPIKKDCFRIDPEVGVPRSVRRTLQRVAELGWLHNCIRRFCEDRAQNRTLGLVCQSLVSALREELTEYYRLVAVLEGQVQQEADSPICEENSSLTLRRLSVWTFDPLNRFKTLYAVVEACKDKKGGALASSVYGFLQHGDPFVRETVKHLLSAVCKPMYVMLSRWILDGELEDPYGEFFIHAKPSVKGERLWHDKYALMKSMVPSFIPMTQANKILATGKSINFLREVCQDHVAIRGRDVMKHALENTSVDALFMEDRDGDLQAMMDSAYLETSRRVLDVMAGQYQFSVHLQALRRYLLLGQGDFIRYLMELLGPELCKSASHLYPHNLSGILESAVRATNAQFEDQDILKRLDVRLLDVSPGDTGWDVFSLDYLVDGPIGTIFTPNAMMMYLRLFNALWRAKRMEWILSGMWKKQATSSKMLRRIPELAPILQQMHLLTSEMVHFIHQMQYYILFEVLECSWDVLIRQVQQAEALDDVITAHENFLNTIVARALLDEGSKELLTRLRAVYDLILQLQNQQEKLHTRALEELELRNQTEECSEKKSERGDGASAGDDVKRLKRQQEFIHGFIPTMRAQIRIIAQSYQDVVHKFLIRLAEQPDVSLQGLSFRLDFNEHYKRRDAKLKKSMTYQHRRLSVYGSFGK